MRINELVKQSNSRLKDVGCRIKIECRGQSLCLRGMMPSKDGSGTFKQQRMNLKLKATAQNLIKAESIAISVYNKILQESFHWLNDEQHQPESDCERTGSLLSSEVIRSFEAKKKSEISSVTWDKTYQPYINTLIKLKHKNCSESEQLRMACQCYPQDSRSRQICIGALSQLARFADIHFSPPLCTYSSPRDMSVPSDECILNNLSKISNQKWKTVYLLMAAYGIRNHECFLCDYSSVFENGKLWVKDGTKTGSRLCLTYPKEWINLIPRPIVLPDINRNQPPQRIGQQVARQFRRYGVSFRPYALRHAWAIRLIQSDIPDVLAAKLLGHSVHSLNHVYRRHLSEDVIESLYLSLM